MVRVHNVTKWRRLGKGEELEIPPGEGPRRVRLELNAPAKTKVYLVREKEEPVFLTVFEGYQVIEFSSPPELCRLQCVAPENVWFFTAEGDQIAVPRPATPSFVRVANRRARNPELEKMMYIMNQNVERRLAAQADEFAAALERVKKFKGDQVAATPGADPETGEVVDEPDRANPEAASGSSDPDEVQPAAAREGDDSGDRASRKRGKLPTGSEGT